MSRSARMLPRSLSCLLCVLAVLLVGVPPVKGDIGRNGGIVILPNATHTSQWGKCLREQFAFQANENVRMRLASGLGQVVVVADCGNGSIPFGTVQDQVLTVSASSLRELKRAGVESFRLRVLNAQLYGYDLLFTLEPNGDVSIGVY